MYDPTCDNCGGCEYDCYYGNPKQPHCQTSKPQTEMKRYYMSGDKQEFFQVEKIEGELHSFVAVYTGTLPKIENAHALFVKELENWQVITKEAFFRAYNRTKERLDKAVFGEDDKPNITLEDIKEVMKIKFIEFKKLTGNREPDDSNGVYNKLSIIYTDEEPPIRTSKKEEQLIVTFHSTDSYKKGSSFEEVKKFLDKNS